MGEGDVPDDEGLGRRFWALWGSFTTANLGDGLSLIAFPLLAVDLTDDARLIAAVAMSRLLPFVVLGLPAGLVIDRFDRRILAIVAQFTRAGVAGAVAVASLTDHLSIPILAAAAFAIGAGEVVTDGGLPAVVRDVVADHQLEIANSRISASQTVANAFIGPPLGAFLYELDPAAPFLSAGGLYLITNIMLSGLRGSFRATPDPDRLPFVPRMMRGLSYVWGHPVLRPLALVVALFSFAGEASGAVFVILATGRLGLSSVQFGLLLAVESAASVTMSFFVARLIQRTSHGTSMRLSVAAAAVGSILLGTTTILGIIVFAMILDGFSEPTWNVVSGTLRQRIVPDAIFGRMMTAYLFIAWGIQPFGAVAGGFVAESLGPEWVFVFSGGLIASLMILGRRLFREVDIAMAPGD